MDKAEILTKAIEKAVDNGWNLGNDIYRYKVIKPFGKTLYLSVLFKHPQQVSFDAYEIEETKWSINDIAYNKQFAKAFWGEGLFDLEEFQKARHFIYTEKTPIYKWQYHLQQMVLKEDPVQYLGQFIY